MTIRDLPENERPISEQFRLVAKAWVDADAAARLLEATKDAVLSQRMMDDAHAPSKAAAEMKVKASPEWEDYLTKMVNARTAANLAKVKLEYIRMKHSEWVSMDANARAERKL